MDLSSQPISPSHEAFILSDCAPTQRTKRPLLGCEAQQDCKRPCYGPNTDLVDATGITIGEHLSDHLDVIGVLLERFFVPTCLVSYLEGPSLYFGDGVSFLQTLMLSLTEDLGFGINLLNDAVYAWISLIFFGHMKLAGVNYGQLASFGVTLYRTFDRMVKEKLKVIEYTPDSIDLSIGADIVKSIGFAQTLEEFRDYIEAEIPKGHACSFESKHGQLTVSSLYPDPSDIKEEPVSPPLSFPSEKIEVPSEPDTDSSSDEDDSDSEMSFITHRRDILNEHSIRFFSSPFSNICTDESCIRRIFDVRSIGACQNFIPCKHELAHLFHLLDFETNVIKKTEAVARIFYIVSNPALYSMVVPPPALKRKGILKAFLDSQIKVIS